MPELVISLFLFEIFTVRENTRVVFLCVKARYFVVSFSQLSFSVQVQIIIQKVIQGKGIRNVALGQFDPSCEFSP